MKHELLRNTIIQITLEMYEIRKQNTESSLYYRLIITNLFCDLTSCIPVSYLLYNK